MLREDGTGAIEYFYGKMGEVTKTRRTMIVPNQAIATYVTQWTYDSHNRLLEMIYPDEEKITYSYNLGGQLEKVHGYKSYGYDYVSKIGYDKFEQRTYLKYCNGAETFYTYDPQRRRLQNLTVNSGGNTIMDNAYTYDAVSNVLSVVNGASVPQSGKAGGQMAHTYTYDALRIKEKNTRNWVDNAQTADVVYTISKVKKTGELETVLKVILDSIDASSNMWTRTDPRHIHSQIDVNIERDRPQILGYLTSIDNSLAILRPDVASKWDYVKNQDLTPDMFTVSSNEIIWWKCPDCGHEWKCSINSMTRKGRFGCAECSKKHRGRSFTQGVVKKVGSLAETMPELAKEWHPIKNGDLTPNDITAGKFKPVWWLCPKCGYEWQASPNNRKRGIGCPCCSGRVPKTGVNDLETLYPELLKEWNYERNSSNNLFPSQLLPKSGKKAWWKCSSCGHEWYAVIASRVKGHGCPHCSKRRKK